MIDTIIFDLDGVICSTDHYHYLAWKKLSDELHISFDEKDNEKLRGVSRMESLDIILEKSSQTYSQVEKEEFANKKNTLYQQYLKQMTPSDLSVEVKETLDQLRNKGYRLAIGSSSKNTKLILKQLGLENYFDAICDGTMIQYSKPHPEVFMKAADLLEKNYKIKVDKKKIELKETIKELGTRNVNIKLYEGVIANLKIDVVAE